MAAATWSIGTPTLSVVGGTVTASVPLKDSGVLACTLTFTMTPARALRIQITNAPGSAGLTDFEAWSDL